jgi:hypothetical protein
VNGESQATREKASISSNRHRRLYIWRKRSTEYNTRELKKIWMSGKFVFSYDYSYICICSQFPYYEFCGRESFTRIVCTCTWKVRMLRVGILLQTVMRDVFLISRSTNRHSFEVFIFNQVLSIYFLLFFVFFFFSSSFFCFFFFY